MSLNFIVNSRAVRNYVDRIASTYVDGKLDYSRIDITIFSNFPHVSVSLDSLSITYPHGRFAQWDGAGMPNPLLDAGRGSEIDTLLKVDRVKLAVTVSELMGGRIRVPEATIRGLGAFLHVYDSTSSNLDILRFPESQDDSSSFSTPMISIREFTVEDNVRAVYTSLADTLYAGADLGRLAVSGNFRFDEDGGVKFRKIAIAIESLVAQALMKDQEGSISLDRLYVMEKDVNDFELGLKADASAKLSGFERLDVPVQLDTRVAIRSTDDNTTFDIPFLDGSLAYVPLHLDGQVRLYRDSTAVKGSLSVKEAPVDVLLKEYGYKLAGQLRDFSTNALLSMDVDAEGLVSKDQLPAITASILIPNSRVDYAPAGFHGSISLDADGSMSSKRYVKANVNDLDVHLPGIDLCASGSAKDVLGNDPALKLRADLVAQVETLLNAIPADLGIIADGKIKLDLDADARLSNILELRYEDAYLHADLTSDLLSVQMPADSLRGRIYAADICLDSTPDGLDIHAGTDSLRFRLGDTFHVRARDMRNSGRMYTSVRNERRTQHFSLNSSEKNVFLYAAGNGVNIEGSRIVLGATRRIRNANAQRRMDGRGGRERSRGRLSDPAAPASANSFVGHDFSLDIDTTIRRYLREWNPVADIDMSGITASLPMMPLHTSVDSIKANFDGDALNVDTLSLAIGSSDLALRGKVGGLRRLIQNRGRSNVDADLKLLSHRLNVNELLAAYTAGQQIEVSGEVVEGDTSFMVEGLEDVQLEEIPPMGVIVLPSNVVATVDVLAEDIDYTDFCIHPFSARLNLQDRVLQLQNTRINTDFGNIDLEAFYATRAKDDISVGAEMSIHEVSADSLIHLLPSVDSLMPALRSFKGKLNCDFSLLTQMDTNMNVIMPSVQGVFRIGGHDLMVEDAGGLRKITRLLRFRNTDIGAIQDLEVNAVMHDSKIEVFPFQLGVDRYRLALNGMQGLDGSMYYHASVLRSPFLVHFGINVFGSFDNWKFTIGLPKYRNGNIPVFSKQLDTMQYNINTLVRNVYERSIEELREYNAMQELERRKRELGYESLGDLLGADESKSAEQLAFEYDAMLDADVLDAEVEAILADSYRETSQLMQEYASDIYNKRILRRMERMAKRQARKAARKNK